jgi:hypothetical protein
MLSNRADDIHPRTSDDEPGSQSPRRERAGPVSNAGPRVLGVLVGVAMIAAAVAFFVGRGFRSPAQIAAASQPPPPSVITAPVRGSSSPITTVLRGTLAESRQISVAAPSDLDGDLPVVTAAPVPAGAVAGNGTVLMGVAGQPVIALDGQVPAYRTLAYADDGVDVSQLQSALASLGISDNGDTPGHYGIGTAAAVAELYEHAGYAPVTAQAVVVTNSPAGRERSRVERLATVPLGQVVFLSDLPARVIRVPPLGARLAPGAEAVELGSGQLSIDLKVDANLASILKNGDKGRASSNLSAASFSGRIVRIAKLAEAAGSTAAPEYAITFVPTDEDDAASLAGQSLVVRVSLAARSTGNFLVPVAAVVTDASGRSSVTVVSHRKQTSVSVRPLLSDGGSEVVDPEHGRLRAGEQVMVGTDAG